MPTTKRPPKKPAPTAERPAVAKASKTRKKSAAAPPLPPEERDDAEAEEPEGDEAPAPAPAQKAKPAAAPTKKAGGAADPEAPAVVPARRLTPEAKAQLNAMLAKGVSLQDALRAVAKWETFVAPVREVAPAPTERPPHPVGGRRPAPRDDDEPRGGGVADDEEPIGKELDDEPIEVSED